MTFGNIDFVAASMKFDFWAGLFASNAFLDGRELGATRYTEIENRGSVYHEARQMSVRNMLGSIFERFSATGVASGLDENRKSKTNAVGSIPLRSAQKAREAAESFRAVVTSIYHAALRMKLCPPTPNQAPEPTTLLVMPRAFARVTPSRVVAHL